MKLYELYIILKPTLKEEEVNSFSSKLGELLTKANFNIDNTVIKPNERLTHGIKHFRQSHNLILDFSGSDELIFPSEMNEILRRDDNVLRYLVFTKSEKMLLKRARQSSILDQLHRERRNQAAGQDSQETTVPTPPVDMPAANVEEIDKKLEEILK